MLCMFLVTVLGASLLPSATAVGADVTGKGHTPSTIRIAVDPVGESQTIGKMNPRQQRKSPSHQEALRIEPYPEEIVEEKKQSKAAPATISTKAAPVAAASKPVLKAGQQTIQEPGPSRHLLPVVLFDNSAGPKYMFRNWGTGSRGSTSFAQMFFAAWMACLIASGVAVLWLSRMKAVDDQKESLTQDQHDSPFEAASQSEKLHIVAWAVLAATATTFNVYANASMLHFDVAPAMPLMLSMWELVLTAVVSYIIAKITTASEPPAEETQGAFTPSLWALALVMSMRAALFPATQTVVLTPLIQMNRVAIPVFACMAALVFFKMLKWGVAPEIPSSRIISGVLVLAGIIAADIGAHFAKTAGWSLESGAAFLILGVVAESVRPILMQEQLSCKSGNNSPSESFGVLWKASAAGAVFSLLGMLVLEGSNLSLTWAEVSANKESYAELLLASGVTAVISNVAVYQLFWRLSDAPLARAACGVGAEILAVFAGWLVFDAPLSIEQCAGYGVALLALWRFLNPLEIQSC